MSPRQNSLGRRARLSGVLGLSVLLLAASGGAQAQADAEASPTPPAKAPSAAPTAPAKAAPEADKPTVKQKDVAPAASAQPTPSQQKAVETKAVPTQAEEAPAAPAKPAQTTSVPVKPAPSIQAAARAPAKAQPTAPTASPETPKPVAPVAAPTSLSPAAPVVAQPHPASGLSPVPELALPAAKATDELEEDSHAEGDETSAAPESAHQTADLAAVDDHTGLAHAEVAHGDVAHGESEHHEAGHGHADGHVPHFSDINWFYGLVGEREGPPSLLFRPPGMPVPLGALLLNSAILFYLIIRYGGPAVKRGLAQRKQRIAGDIQAAARMREDAEKQLAYYEQKLHHMSTELERIMKETREQAQAEQAKAIEEAKTRRAVMEVEARQMVEHELAHARQEAIAALVSRTVQNAAARIQQSLEDADQARLSEVLIASVKSQLGKSEVRS